MSDADEADKNALIVRLSLEKIKLKQEVARLRDALNAETEEAVRLNSVIENDCISKDSIARCVTRLFERSEIPLPPSYSKGEGIATKVTCKNIQFLSGGIYLDVSVSGCGYGSSGSTFSFYMSGLIPCEPSLYPDFHIGYAKPKPPKRVRKAPAKKGDVVVTTS